MLKLGRFDIYVVSDGPFVLDGGTMFGIVPKVVWSQFVTVDERNMMVLGTNCLLVVAGKRKVLIEAGLGPKLNDKMRRIYRRSGGDEFEKSLRTLGFKVEDIDLVIPTHLHMDHVGGATVYQGKTLKPRFPKAKYLLQRQEWEAATHPNRLSRGSYWPENFLPIVEAHQEEWVEGDTEVMPGLKVFQTGAHTPGHQAIKISSEGKILFCGGDLVPTRWHVRQTFLCSYDLCPMEVMESKTRWLEQAKEEKWILHWYHDPTLVFGMVAMEGEHFVAQPLKEYDNTYIIGYI